MSWEKFDDECPGCKPALIDLKTNKVKPDDSPEMIAIFSLWKETTLEERQAWHRACCSNSKDKEDRRIVNGLVGRIEKALAEL